MGRYIDPLIDFSFKRIFAAEPNKALLISFLNEVLRGRKHIVDLVSNKNEHPGENPDSGGVIFDLTCTADNGEQFLIEVQRNTQRRLRKRMLYYAARLISDQAPKGRRKEWDYAISEVYVLVLIDGFTIAPPRRLPDSTPWIHDISLCYRNSGEVFYEGLGFIYLELINFVKTGHELETDLDRWLFVLKHLGSMNQIPLYLRKPIFEKLFQVAEYCNLSKQEKQMYDIELKRKWDNANVLATAREEGREEGKIAIVKNLVIKLGLPDSEIADIAEVTIEFVRKIRAEIGK